MRGDSVLLARALVDYSAGCYQCSRRRIDCDRAEPSCKKCLDRNLHCSGLGIRYRFADDVTAKNKTCQRWCLHSQQADECSNHEKFEASTLTKLTEYPHNGYLSARLQFNYSNLERHDPACPTFRDNRSPNYNTTDQEAASIDVNLSTMSCRRGDRHSINTIALDSPMEQYLLLYCRFHNTVTSLKARLIHQSQRKLLQCWW